MCASCIFETSSRIQCRAKWKKSGSIRKEAKNDPGDIVAVYQLQSAQTGLVPQLSVKFTSARIFISQLMVDNFSDLTYLHMMRSTSQEEILAGKEVFERWTSTFGVKTNRYHVDIGIFAEQPSISTIEDDNQTITFCWIGPHHQNAIVER